MATTPLPLIILSLTTLLLLSFQAQSQTPTAPAPAPSGPVNLTAILEKGGQFTTLIRLLNTTQIGNQITNQLNSSSEGLTVLAPTDNAFNNLKAGTLNTLNPQQQIQLILYHVVPKFYTLNNLLLVSNPVPTQATGQDGPWGLNFTGQSNQVNVSTGVVETRINNPLRQDMPLAVYAVDQVLLPKELFGVKSPAAAPEAPPAKGKSDQSNSTVAAQPSTPDGSGAGRINVALGLVVGIWLICMGPLS